MVLFAFVIFGLLFVTYIIFYVVMPSVAYSNKHFNNFSNWKVVPLSSLRQNFFEQFNLFFSYTPNLVRQIQFDQDEHSMAFANFEFFPLQIYKLEFLNTKVIYLTNKRMILIRYSLKYCRYKSIFFSEIENIQKDDSGIMLLLNRNSFLATMTLTNGEIYQFYPKFIGISPWHVENYGKISKFFSNFS